MTIDRIGSIDPLSRYNNTKRVSKAAKKDTADTVSISADAKSMGEVYRTAEAVRNSSEVRLDRIAEVKKKLEDPDYIDDKVLSGTADKLMELFGL